MGIGVCVSFFFSPLLVWRGRTQVPLIPNKHYTATRGMMTSFRVE